MISLFSSTGLGYVISSISARLVSGGGKKNIFLKTSILLLKVSVIVLLGFLKNGNLKIGLNFLFYFLPYFASF